MKARYLKVEMDDSFWELLERFRLTINTRAKERGLPRVSAAKLTGAILSYFFLAHHGEILSGTYDAKLNQIQCYLNRLFSPTELAALRAAAVPQVHGRPDCTIPSVPGDGVPQNV